MSEASGIAISSNLSHDPDTLPVARPSSTYSRRYLFRRSYLPYPTWHSFTPSPVLSFRHNAPTDFPIGCNGHARRVSSSPSCDRRPLKGAQDTPSILANWQRDRCERSLQDTQGRFGPNGFGRREIRRSGPTMAEAGIAGVSGSAFTTKSTVMPDIITLLRSAPHSHWFCSPVSRAPHLFITLKGVQHELTYDEGVTRTPRRWSSRR
jgi:hypothetical protein